MVSTRDLVVVDLNGRADGHEQDGERTAVVLRTMQGRFPMFIVAPTTSNISGSWITDNPGIYPRIAKGSGAVVAEGSCPAYDGLHTDSVLLLDNIQAVDPTRIKRKIGRISQTDHAKLMRLVAVALGFVFPK